MTNIRDKIWWLAKAKSRCSEGSQLPRWLLSLRALLYPLDFFYWKMREGRGYQPESDTWIINGVKYKDSTLRTLAAARGKLYLVNVIDGDVVIKRVDTLSRILLK